MIHIVHLAQVPKTRRTTWPLGPIPQLTTQNRKPQTLHTPRPPRIHHYMKALAPRFWERPGAKEHSDEDWMPGMELTGHLPKRVAAPARRKQN